MNNPFSAMLRYFHWRNDCLFKAPYFPTWCDTGKAVDANRETPRRALNADGSVEWNAEEEAVGIHEAGVVVGARL